MLNSLTANIINQNMEPNMARDQLSLLKHEARKDPRIAELINSGLNAEQIDQLNDVKPWIRKALKRISVSNAAHKAVMSREDDILANSRFFFAPDPMGIMFEHTGMTQYVKLDRGSLELVTGALFWRPLSGGVLYETIFCKYTDNTITARLIGDQTRSQYTEYFKQRVRGLATISYAATAISNNPLNNYGVKFFK